MSRQSKKPRLVIVPDEVANPPGQAEAAEIRRLYEISNAGIRAFVLMGFRLIEVKARLPHGRYMAWIGDHIADLKPRHLHNSRLIAEGIAVRLGWDRSNWHRGANLEGESNWTRVSNLEALPPEVCEIIDGKGYRTLLMELRDPPDAEKQAKEEASRLLCEERWGEHPEERDEWEPRVLAGEITYHAAHVGMLGAAATLGQEKQEKEIWDQFDTKLAAMKAPFRKLEKKISEDGKARETLVKHIRAWAAMDMTHGVLAAWKEALLPLEIETDGEEGGENADA